MASEAGPGVVAALHEAAIRPRNVFTRPDVTHDLVIDCDAVVIGSGAGGAPIAAELAEAGFDVVVLEEGSYYQTRDFTANTSQMVRQLYRDGGATIAIGNPPIMFQEGRAVGGSTVINGGMSWRTPDDILAHWRDLSGIDELTARALEPYYERVEKRIHVAAMDDDAIGNDNWLLEERRGREGLEDRRQPAQPSALRRLESLRVRLPDRREAKCAGQLHPARVALRRAGLRRCSRVPRDVSRQTRDRRDRQERGRPSRCRA